MKTVESPFSYIILVWLQTDSIPMPQSKFPIALIIISISRNKGPITLSVAIKSISTIQFMIISLTRIEEMLLGFEKRSFGNTI